ncbi:MAG: glycosyltransferase family 9 protein [Candidatus Kapaibacteriota bacterium]
MKILTILLGRIGDMILLTPFFELIKEKYPESQIEVIASRHNYIVLKNNPNIAKIHIYDKKILHTLQLLSYLRLNQFDFYIDPKDHFSHESAIFANIVRAKTKIGYNKPDSHNFDIAIEDISKHSNLHFVQRLWLPLENLEISLPKQPLKPILFEDVNSSKYVEEYILKLEQSKPIICCNISASKENKMLTTAKWIEFLKEAIKKSDFNYVLTFEPKHKILADEIKHSLPKIQLFSSRNLMDVISLIKQSYLVITPDTSIVHIAAAFNKPIIAFHSGIMETYVWFRPLSDVNSTIFAEEGVDDLSSIDANRIIDEFNKMLIILQKENN